MKDKGAEITLASPKGGQPPIDPKSALPESQTPATLRFNEDDLTQSIVANTVQLKNVSEADFDSIFYPGGHGPLWDLSEDQDSINLIQDFYNNDKPVSAVCHAPAVFKNTKDLHGNPLVKNKKVATFSNTEEAAVALTDVVPFLVEDMLKNHRGLYSKADDWMVHAIEDGLLITGQNPASSEAVAEKLYQKLSKN